MKQRLISISLIVLLVISLASCSSEKYIHELKTRFEGFSADSNVIVVLDDSVFYFADHTLSLSDITDDEELNNGYLFWDGKLFFTTVKQNGGFGIELEKHKFQCAETDNFTSFSNFCIISFGIAFSA